MPTTEPAANPDPVRRRQPPQVRRRMLLEAARSVIAERGLHATTIRDVAAAGGVAVGTVTYHFSGIAEVLAGVLEAEMQEFSAPIMAAAELAPAGRDALERIVNGLLADGERAGDHWKLWLDFWALSAHDAGYARWQASVYDDLHDLTRRMLERCVLDGAPPIDDVGGSAVAVIALLDGLVVQCYQPRSRLRPDQGRQILGQFISSLVG